MRRRTLLHVLTTSLPVVPLARVRLGAQMRGFTPDATAILREVADTVLPASLGADKVTLLVDRFLAWGREYEEGIALSHGYGDPTLVKSGPSPVPDYVAQLSAIDAASKAKGGRFATRPLETRREILSGALAAAKVETIPGRPMGRHVVADLMAFYFRSSEANDLAYRARIGRQMCRSLELTTRRPAPMA